jgi:hypothetical protein
MSRTTKCRRLTRLKLLSFIVTIVFWAAIWSFIVLALKITLGPESRAGRVADTRVSLSMASRNCPAAVMKTARWWPWDLPSWRPPTALGQVWGIAVSSGWVVLRSGRLEPLARHWGQRPPRQTQVPGWLQSWHHCSPWQRVSQAGQA